MILNNIRDSVLKEIFDAMEEAFNTLNIDFYIIGAVARNVWYQKGQQSFRQTKDIDFAIMVGNAHEYELLKKYLKEHKNFEVTKNNAFVMIAPDGTQIDILPFGSGIEIDDAVTILGGSFSRIYVNGFAEVFKLGTQEVKLETGHKFKVASLSAIVLLKLISYDDRPEHRSKDAQDIGDIIDHFFDLQADLVYTYSDLFENEQPGNTNSEIGAIVIGREIKKIIESNQSLSGRIKHILKEHIKENERSSLIQNMVRGTSETIEQSVSYLQYLLNELH